MGRVSAPAPVTVAVGPRLGGRTSRHGLSPMSRHSSPSVGGSPLVAESGGDIDGSPVSRTAFDDWALKLWRRMDRDQSGSITKQELNCDEFQQVLKSVLVPEGSASTSVTYARSEQNVEQALSFCLRKADQNNDGTLSFEEFKAFLRVLCNQKLAQHKANLIFALFDLDGSQTIDKEEFREIYRYYLGHHPTAEQFAEQWDKLDVHGVGEATLAQYTRWLQSSADPLFKQYAPPVEGLDEDEDEVGSGDKVSLDTVEGLLAHRRRIRSRHRPEWNEAFNQRDISKNNEVTPKQMKRYFSRPQSLPDLKKYINRHSTRFDSLQKQLARPPDPKPVRVLSTDTQGLPEIMPQRHGVGGSMRDKHGRQLEWIDRQTPRWLSHGEGASRVRPGSLSLRSPGPPPAYAWKGKDIDEDYSVAETANK
mmetsp:Transcript_133399/g.333035  ORF Transcript_133399/g.333035 Transcript_133399/m.333035 type:complete len:421 (-) Transcript_133399:129-1391(-)